MVTRGHGRVKVEEREGWLFFLGWRGAPANERWWGPVWCTLQASPLTLTFSPGRGDPLVLVRHLVTLLLASTLTLRQGEGTLGFQRSLTTVLRRK